MKHLSIIFLLYFILSSCSTDVDPLMEFSIITTPSQFFESAEIDVSSFRFKGANLQNYLGSTIDQNLTERDTSVVFNQFHWASELTSIRPDLEINLIKDGEVYVVNVPYIEGVELGMQLTTVVNQEYEILLTIDSENAFELMEDVVQFNWEYVSAEIVEK